MYVIIQPVVKKHFRGKENEFESQAQRIQFDREQETKQRVLAEKEY